MVDWSEQMIDACGTNSGSFKVAIEKFVKCYSRPVRFALQEPNGELPLVSRHLENAEPIVERLTRRPPQQVRLLYKVHTFKALYRICCCESFTVEIEGVHGAQPLGVLATVEFRSFARSALETAERDILAELDDSVYSRQLDTSRTPALWAAFWQLIFVYNRLLRCEEPRDQDATELLNGVAVFYSAVFRRKQDLNMSLSKAGGASNKELDQAFKNALKLREPFCKYRFAFSLYTTPDADGCFSSRRNKEPQ